MSQRNFPDWITAYEQFTQFSEAPLPFHRWTAVSAIAGALRRRVRLEMGYFRWFPNFFLCFVAPPGVVSKSSTADIGMSLLRALPDIKFGPSAVTWQALITAMAESREDFPTPDGEYMPMCALTIVASELGTLIVPGDTAILNALTELWDGKDGAFLKKTKGGGDESIENPWINLIGCTTPSWIAENFGSYFIGGGFASRTLFVYAETKRQLVAYPGEHLPTGHTHMERALVEDLRGYAQLQGSFELTPAARRWGEKWYEKHWTNDQVLLDERLRGYGSRKQAHIHKTAMVLAVSRTGQLIIDEQDLVRADEWVTALEPNMVRVFEGMGREQIVEVMARLGFEITRNPGITRTALYGRFMGQFGLETFDQAMQGLAASGMIGYHNNGDGEIRVVLHRADDLAVRLGATQPGPPPVPQISC